MRVTTTFPGRRVLACVSGMSPAIVTETLHALVMRGFVPDEIHVITTGEGAPKVHQQLLDPAVGHFPRYLREYRDRLQGRTIRFDDDTIHLISREVPAAALPAGADPFADLVGGSVRPAAGPAPAAAPTRRPLADIAGTDDNRAAADTIYRVLRQLKSVPGTRLHASVAGGRKSMSFYMGQAFSLVAEPDDELSHVLVKEPFENPHQYLSEPEVRKIEHHFFFPPREPRTYDWMRDGQPQQTRTDEPDLIQLAELSVLRLGPLLGPSLPARALESFDVAMRLAQAAVVAPQVEVVLRDDGHGCLKVLGETVELPPQQFLVFALHALVRKHEDELEDGAALILEHLPPALLTDLAGREVTAAGFKDVRSKIVATLREVIGPAAEHFQISAVGPKRAGQTRPQMLKLPAECIRLSGLQVWWRKLQIHLPKAA